MPKGYIGMPINITQSKARVFIKAEALYNILTTILAFFQG
jgi:hypothetical protein